MAETFFLGVTYVAATVSDAASGAIAALLLLSHFPMLMGVAYAFMARHARLAVAGVTSLLISNMYHACRANMVCLGVPVDQWRRADHTAVLWLIGVLGLHLIMAALARPQSQYFFTITGYLVWPIGYLAVALLPYTLMSGVIMFLYVVFVAAVRLALLPCNGDLCGCAPDNDHSYPDNTTEEGQRQNGWTTLWLVVGIGAAAVSLGCYFIGGSAPEGNTVIDGVAHIIWHVFSGIALWALSAAVSERTEWTLRHHYGHKDVV